MPELRKSNPFPRYPELSDGQYLRLKILEYELQIKRLVLDIIIVLCLSPSHTLSLYTFWEYPMLLWMDINSNNKNNININVTDSTEISQESQAPLTHTSQQPNPIPPIPNFSPSIISSLYRL